VYERLDKLEKAHRDQGRDIARDFKNQLDLVTTEVHEKFTQLYQHEQQGKMIDLLGNRVDRVLDQVKEWITLMNQVMDFTSLLDVQDEKDRTSLSLIGQKPLKLERSGRETSPDGRSRDKY
jgi:uncharacterized protein YicC (UPF0701 family)